MRSSAKKKCIHMYLGECDMFTQCSTNSVQLFSVWDTINDEFLEYKYYKGALSKSL